MADTWSFELRTTNVAEKRAIVTGTLTPDAGEPRVYSLPALLDTNPTINPDATDNPDAGKAVVIAAGDIEDALVAKFKAMDAEAMAKVPAEDAVVAGWADKLAAKANKEV